VLLCLPSLSNIDGAGSACSTFERGAQSKPCQAAFKLQLDCQQFTHLIAFKCTLHWCKWHRAKMGCLWAKCFRNSGQQRAARADIIMMGTTQWRSDSVNRVGQVHFVPLVAHMQTCKAWELRSEALSGVLKKQNFKWWFWWQSLCCECDE
jgi:hypothetical protein